MEEEDPFDRIMKKLNQKKALLETQNNAQQRNQGNNQPQNTNNNTRSSNIPRQQPNQNNQKQNQKVYVQKHPDPQTNAQTNTQVSNPQRSNNDRLQKRQQIKPVKKTYIAKDSLKQKQSSDFQTQSFTDISNNQFQDDQWSQSSFSQENSILLNKRKMLAHQDMYNKEVERRKFGKVKQQEQKRVVNNFNQQNQRQNQRRDRRDRRTTGEQRQQLRTEVKRENKNNRTMDEMDEDRDVKSEQQKNYDRRQERRQAKGQDQSETNRSRNSNYRNNYNNNNQNNQRNNNNQNNNRNERDNNRNNRNQRRQPRQLVYRNQCQKYLKHYQRLQQNQQELGIEIKNLKKYVLTSDLVKTYDQRPKQISVLKCLDCPAIFFQYLYKGQKRYMQLKDLKKGTGPKIYDFYSIIKKIYDMHYYSVDIDYEQSILQFAKAKGKQHNIYLALNKRDNRYDQGQKKTSLLFYYCINQKSVVEITFFDFTMKQINFGEKYVQMKKSLVDLKHYESFQKFLKSTKGDDQLDIVNIGEQQVESDQELKNSRTNLHVNLSYEIRKVQKRIEEILSHDITELQDEMEEKNQQQLQLIQAQSADTAKIDRLGEEVEKMNRDIQNFKSVKYDVEKQLRQVIFKRQKTVQHYQSINLALKRLIFAKKQLDSDLPILGKKQQIFELLNKNNLIILQGETGSGKSTQLPQILCEYYKLFENPNVLPVLVTQPRKIATRSLAQRVAEQLQQKGGHFVDYVASSGKMHHPKAKIIFKMDRLVLDELVESPTLDDYSCLVIDEAHQRTISIDVILGLVKDLLSKRKDFKVIITSASMEISLFEKYFSKKTLKVSGRMYPVNIKYLPSNQEETVKKIEKAIDQQLLTQRNVLKDKYKGHILVFCSDTGEIEKLAEIFRKKLNHNVFMVIPLHGKLTPEEQKKAFTKTKEHKLIFASRIAETAITIDGVKVVIDPGWDREMQYDQKTKFSSMKLQQISQSSAKQRAGRAGRTQQGYCFRLYSEHQFKGRRFNKLPEIKNIALETLILRLKTLGIENVSTFDYIQRPDEQGMKTSTQVLKMIGCLNQKGKITTIGSFLVKIPIEPFLARAIIEGCLMQKALKMKEYDHLDRKCSDLAEPVIEILCMILSAGNLFRITENFKQLGDYAKYKNFSHQKGDFFFLKNIFDQFKNINNYDRRELNEWLQKSFLIKKTLLQVKDLVKEITTIIKQFDISEKQMKYDIIKCKTKLQRYTNQEDRILSCLTTCFAANLCLYSGHPQIGYTYMNLQKIVTIYGTSCLSLLGICPKWIMAYDFYENKDGKLFCKVANQINYQFLQHTVEDYVLQKYRINNLREFNPFYKQISIKLQSLILLKLKQSYETREYNKEKEIQFLKKLNLAFNEAENSVSVFIKCNQKLQQQKQEAQKQLQKFIESLRTKAQTNYIHNYIGNIYVTIGNGFSIQKIYFKTTQKVYEFSGLDQETFDKIKDDWSQYAQTETFRNNKIKIYLENEQTILHLQNYIQYLIQKEEKKFILRKEFSDKRKKLPQTKIYLHWYAGKAQKNNILIQFFSNNYRDQKNKLTNQEIVNLTERQEHYLQQSLQKLRLQRIINQPRRHRVLLAQRLQNDMTEMSRKAAQIDFIRLTKSHNGINIMSDTLDEIDLSKFFNKLIVTNKIDLQFEIPKFIKKFRDPERPQCEWKDSQWIEKIEQLLDQVTDKKQSCIRVWGYGVRAKEGQKLSQYEKSFRIDMKAEIKTFDWNLFERLKDKFDDQKNILGYQKLHVSSVFTQSVVGISEKAFNCMKDEYDYNIENFIKQYPGLIIDVVIRQTRKNEKKSKVYLYISSEIRQHILKPVRILNNLFTPKYIALSDSQFRYLNSKQGCNTLEEIEILFDYKIYFGFDKYQRKVKLYCHESLENDIKNVLKAKLGQVKYQDQEISYKGKNLKKIEKMIKEKLKQVDDFNQNKKNKEKKFLDYEIKFSFRKIKIMADITTFNQVRQKIMEVKIQAKDRQCPICFQQMITPYKLFNCKHSFCWFCLSSTIKDFKIGQNMELKCPFINQNDGKMCNQMINIYDIAKILSEQQLYQIFDIHISKFIDKNTDRFQRCSSPDCEQIFDIETINLQNQIDCQLCGKHFCMICQISHKNYTCKEWKDMMNLSDEYLSKLGIKKCPKCKTGIERSGGCFHMTCTCGAHVCWLCNQLFGSSKQCYDHLARDHNGIFPDDPNI